MATPPADSYWDMSLGWIRYVGGGILPQGPLNPLESRYHRALASLLKPLDGTAWQQWWRSSGLPPCHIYNWERTRKTRVLVRLDPRRVRVTIDRSVDPATTPDGSWDPGDEAARQDVAAMLNKLQQRFELAAPPALGSGDIDADMTADEFWEFCPRRDESGYMPVEQDIRELAAILSTYSLNRIRSFQAHLERALTNLEVSAKPLPAEFRPMFAQCCTAIMLGRDQYRRMKAHPDLLSQISDHPDSLWLVRLAPLAEDDYWRARASMEPLGD